MIFLPIKPLPFDAIPVLQPGIGVETRLPVKSRQYRPWRRTGSKKQQGQADLMRHLLIYPCKVRVLFSIPRVPRIIEIVTSLKN